MVREKGNDYVALYEGVIYDKGQKKLKKKSMERSHLRALQRRKSITKARERREA